MSVCLAGAAAGLVLALVGSHFLSSVLVGTGAADPLTFVVVPGLLASVALVACYLPARRVTSANVAGALRED
jgi:putative ABC transport system permease protein